MRTQPDETILRKRFRSSACRPDEPGGSAYTKRNVSARFLEYFTIMKKGGNADCEAGGILTAADVTLMLQMLMLEREATAPGDR